MSSSVKNNNNNVLHSLQNVENYKGTLNYSMNDILHKKNLLIIDYLKFITERVNLKNTNCNKFILIRGVDTISHVFNLLLYYTKNIDLAFYHGQKAFYFYVEFIEQISDDQHTFLQLNSRDATMFVYKKTIFDMNCEYKKVVDSSLEKMDLLYIHSNIIKSVVSFFVHHPDAENKKRYTENIILKTENIIDALAMSKFNKNAFRIIFTFVEQIGSTDIDCNKYFSILEMVIKKMQKNKFSEIKLLEKMQNGEFYERLERSTEDFVGWFLT
jgi:hypothetical protein